MTSEGAIKRVGAVAVAYQPSDEQLDVLIHRLRPQLTALVIVVNAADPMRMKSRRQRHADVYWITNLTNDGLAAAQNQGIRRLQALDIDAVLLLDQDTLPGPSAITKLTGILNRLCRQQPNVAALGAAYHREGDAHWPGFVQLGWMGLKRVHPSAGNDWVRADFLIASGTLIRRCVLDEVGEMDESLFIDHVDTEWCLRVQSRGYVLYGTDRVRLTHNLGDVSRRIWLGRGRRVAVHQPWRYTMMYRNSFLLYRRGDLPLRWKWADLLRMLALAVFVGATGPNRARCLRMMVRGISDGLRGRSGPPAVV